MAAAASDGLRQDKMLILPDGEAPTSKIPADFVLEPAVTRRITLKVVMDNSLTGRELAEFTGLDSEQALDKARELKTLHLEWQGIAEITNLEAFEGAEVVYLHRNQIERIEGLESMTRLQFLALQHNRITSVENLLHLRELEFLDLSSNRIEDLDEEELPVSINILNLRDNSCTSASDYQQCILARLPILMHLDGHELPDRVAAMERAAEQARERGDAALPNMESLLRTSDEAAASEDIPAPGGERGLSAYWRRDELRGGLASAVNAQIEAYSVETLADVDGLGRHCEEMVTRSRARQQQLDSADASGGLSLTQEQLAEVRRLKAAVLQRQADAQDENSN